MSAISAVQKEFCRIAFQPPPPLKQMDHLWDFFRRNLVIFWKQLFWLLKWIYFDNDNGHTLSLDGIVMDIMVENGEVW